MSLFSGPKLVKGGEQMKAFIIILVIVFGVAGVLLWLGILGFR